MDSIPYEEEKDEADAEVEYGARFDGELPDGDETSILDRPIKIGSRTFNHDMSNLLDLGAHSTRTLLEELPRMSAEVTTLQAEAARHAVGLKAALERQKLLVRLEINQRIGAAMSFAPAGTKAKKPSEKQIDWDVALDPRVRTATADLAEAEQVATTLTGWAKAIEQSHASVLAIMNLSAP